MKITWEQRNVIVGCDTVRYEIEDAIAEPRRGYIDRDCCYCSKIITKNIMDTYRIYKYMNRWGETFVPIKAYWVCAKCFKNRVSKLIDNRDEKGIRAFISMMIMKEK